MSSPKSRSRSAIERELALEGSSKPKTIAIISNTSWSLINFRSELIAGLRNDGHRVVTMSPNDDPVLQRQLNLISDEFIPLEKLARKGKNPLKDMALCREIKSILQDKKIDVAFTFTPKPNIYTSLAAKELATTVIPTVNGLGNVFIKRGLTQHIISLLYRRAFKACEKIIFQNPDDRDYFLKRDIISDRQPLLSPGSGVSLIQFPTVGNGRIGNTELRFLFSARLVEEKGVFEFLQAAEALKLEGSPAQFWMLGMPADNPSSVDVSVLENYERRGIIEYHGYTDDMNAALEKTDVLVLPSYYREGIPRVLLEGLSKGLPIITADTIGCRETVIDGKNGYLVRPKCHVDLADAMRKMIQIGPSARQKMGENSRFMAETKFDVNQVIEIYRNQIRRIDGATIATRKPDSFTMEVLDKEPSTVGS